MEANTQSLLSPKSESLVFNEGGHSVAWFTELNPTANSVEILVHDRLWWDVYDTWPEKFKNAPGHCKYYGSDIWRCTDDRIATHYFVPGMGWIEISNPKHIFDYRRISCLPVSEKLPLEPVSESKSPNISTADPAVPTIPDTCQVLNNNLVASCEADSSDVFRIPTEIIESCLSETFNNRPNHISPKTNSSLESMTPVNMVYMSTGTTDAVATAHETDEIAQLPQLSKEEYAREQKRLYPNRGKRWTPHQEEITRNAYTEGSDVQKIASIIGRSPLAVACRLVMMGIVPSIEDAKGYTGNTPHNLRELKAKV